MMSDKHNNNRASFDPKKIPTMGTKSGSLDYWRKYFGAANSDIFELIENAILVAASDFPKEFKMRRDRIAERLYSCRNTKCSGCDHVELAVSEDVVEDDEERDVGFKSGLGGNGSGSGSGNGNGNGSGSGSGSADGEDLEGVGKESKMNSSTTEHREMDANRASNYTYDEAEALNEEIEEERLIFGEVLRIKEILAHSEDESANIIFESLRRLQLMELSVEILQGTEIGKVVNRLKKHSEKNIRELTRILIVGWKVMVDEWVKATAAAAIAECSPDSVKPSVDGEEEEEEEEWGLPSPPLDEVAFLATQTTPMELSQFFDGMDDDGNPRNSGIRENRRKPSMEKQSMSKVKEHPTHEANVLIKENRGQTMKKQEAVTRQSKPSYTDSAHGRSLKPSSEHKIKDKINFQQTPHPVGIQNRPVAYQQAKSRGSDEVSVQIKLEASKRKLQERYQEAENAKKQRTIQVMELHQLPKQPNQSKQPKQGFGHRNNLRNGNNNRLRANGRR